MVAGEFRTKPVPTSSSERDAPAERLAARRSVMRLSSLSSVLSRPRRSGR